ncbi:MAG: TIGR00341 family protein [Bauldia sp.]|uniref:TIGR00341 family protein n=1 Tax=Bauldia sp. TaxID=2575872 RepID=UPI001DC119B4|nr:TIGR00341 family protein [Bauldia sp.]MCB1496054.1 TIGR00341 family protein [Bauldia sp.]
MSLRLILAIFPDPLAERIRSAAEGCEPIDLKIEEGGDDGLHTAEIVVSADNSQKVLDALQSSLEGEDGWRINVLPVEATLPRLSEEEVKRQESNRSTAAREELYEDVASGARVDENYIVLTLISAVVAAIGLNEDNVAVIIGAMVIAPLLGPNLAFSLGAALGDLTLMRRAAVTSITGVAITLALSVLVGLVVPANMESAELLRRTHVWYGDVVLAFASGVAASLSITSRLASTLVGVMVAVALMPPAVAAGFLAGGGNFASAFSALILLATNVVCLNLSSQLVFIWKGIRPRRWLERRAAKNAVRTNLVVLGVLVIVLIAIIYVWTRLFE